MSGIKVSEGRNKSFIEFWELPMPEQQKFEKWTISAKVEKGVRIVLYGPAISQSDRRNDGPYQLPLNK